MPFGDTAKKIQRVTSIAEDTYERLNQLVSQLQDLRERVEATSDQIETMDRELAEQRAIVEALAEQQGVDVDAVLTEVREQPDAAEPTPEEAGDATGDAETSNDADDAPGATTGPSDGETADSEP